MTLFHDLRVAGRSLVRQPAFSLMVVGLLSLGIGANAAIFSVFNGLFLRPLPFEAAERLVDLDETAPLWSLEHTGIAYPDFHAWRERNRTFDGMAAWQNSSFNLSLDGRADRLEGSRVTFDLGAVLGVQPVVGRDFTEADDRPGAAAVALLGFGLWQERFGGEPAVVGEPIHLNGVPHTIVGVLAPEAVFPGQGEVWVPLAAAVDETRGYYLRGVGRLKPEVSVEAATDDLRAVHRAMVDARPVNEITSPVIAPLRRRYLGDLQVVASVLMGAVGIVLLIACANVAGLLLARGAVRGRELALKAALGASRGRLIRQLMAESLLLSTSAAALGVVLGYVALDAFLAGMPSRLPRWVSFELDHTFAAFCLVATGLTALLFGLAPALRGATSGGREALVQTTGRATTDRRGRLGSSALVVGEIALAAVLLIGAGFLLQAFRNVQRVDPGFRADHVLTYRVSLPGAPYDTDERRMGFFEVLLTQTAALPGVESVGVTTSPPLGGHWGQFFEAEGAPPLGPDEENPVTLVRVVSPGYLWAMGVGLAGGRFFTEQDGRTEGARSVIVNETMARRLWPAADPIGRRLRNRGDGDPWMTVVGVARDVRHYGLDEDPREGLYLPLAQRPVSSVTVVLRTTVDPVGLAGLAADTVAQIDADLPVYDLRTMSDRLDESLWVRRAYSRLVGVFAGVALLLSLAGIYGIVSYSVSQRTKEFGIRMALGARRGQVARNVLGHGAFMVLGGAAIGLAAAYWLVRYTASLLFGVGGTEPAVYVGVATVLAVVTLVANFVPAWRAARIDPARVLRAE